MPWTLYTVGAPRRGELETALHDDVVSRQSQKVRDAPSAGGPAGQLFVLIEGSAEGVARAETLLGPLGEKLKSADADVLYRKLKDEEENASSGMGLFFTE